MEFNKHTTRRPLPSLSQNKQFFLFAKNFIKHPRMLGSIIPSSPFLVRRMLSHIDWQRARVLVEYGPGVGTFTREILRQMHPEAVLLVLETNEDFVAFLEQTCPDPRLQVIHGSAEDIQEILAEKGLGAADYVIAGIPLSTLPATTKDDILRSTQQVIAPSGAFLLYQFSPSILPHLHKTFSSVQRNFIPLNFLPAHFYRCSP
ncbi:Phospholipid N-methyltransferase [Modicisalibacter ilicicola DSM 19980]|uniref:Phospholipid N-methyltransferase n=1 Tax=Modicisalibacter ilicicola DSM 19980 TaxID=1121942 RepID=A0A1M4T368_9GAMM|nr:rRNA adenine N-6-methyltransferase family protein [Halomonas ilicicola]SHE38854.1 Phospholipid N-methyltransferase [Halomonas ilicicola DSM 19980]